MHNERELDRVLGIDGIELVGINNRNLGKFQLMQIGLNTVFILIVRLCNSICGDISIKFFLPYAGYDNLKFFFFNESQSRTSILKLHQF